jgi:hypothetical protein
MDLRCAVVGFCALACFEVAGCEGATNRADPRFSTPERTIETLLSAYGLQELSQAEIRERFARRERFELRDRAAYQACFADLAGTAGEGFAGWVVGALAAGRDQLRVEIVGDRATVSPRDGVRIVLLRGRDGAYRILLRESVPEEVRRGLTMIAERAERRARRTGAALHVR